MSQVDPILAAVGRVLKDVDEVYSRRFERINLALEAIDNKPVKAGEPGKDADPAAVLARLLDNPEAMEAISAALVREFAADPTLMEQLKGRQGDSVDPDTVAGLLAVNESFIARTKAKDAPVEILIERLLNDVRFLEKARGPEGKRAPDVDLDALADRVMVNADFRDRVKGKDGVSPTPDAVARHLLTTPEFIEATKAAEVDPHAVAVALTKNDRFMAVHTAPDAIDVAYELLNDPRFIEKCAQPPLDANEVANRIIEADGFLDRVKGRDADPEAVAKVLAQNPQFRDIVKAPDADAVGNGLLADPKFIQIVTPPPVDTAEIAKRIIESDGFADSVRGKDGKDADPVAILAALEKAVYANKDFVDSLRAPAPDLMAIAKEVMSNKAFMESLRGPAGKDADIDEVAERIKADSGFMDRIKGADGRDAPVVNVFPIRDNGQYDKGGIGSHLGGLFMATRKAYGTPLQDSGGWMPVVNGIASASLTYDARLREITHLQVLSDGTAFTHKIPDMPRRVARFEDMQQPGDTFYEATEDEGCLMHVYDGVGYKTFDLRGPVGPRGRKGAAGVRGPKVIAGRFDNGEIILTDEDGNEFVVEGMFEAVEGMFTRALTDHIASRMSGLKGQWKADTSYIRGDMVIDHVGTYVAAKDTSAPISDTDSWTLIARWPKS